MAMQPEAARHRMQQAVPALLEFPPLQLREIACLSAFYWQPISPSTVAGATAETLPMKIAHVSGYD
jgi:hypothetical protein